MVAVLQPITDGKYIAIDRAVVLVGRSADCDAVITASKKISRRHCCLVQVDEFYYVRDLGSMNGVWLNGSRVNRESKIGHGDRLAIGDVEFLFHPNARIEQKQTVTPATMPNTGDAEIREVQPIPNGNDGDLPIVDAVENLGESDNSEDQFEILGDVLDMDDDLLETNEVEIIDEPIIDENSDDYLDDIVIYED